MKQIMKKLVPFMLAFVLLASCGAFAKAETADDAAEEVECFLGHVRNRGHDALCAVWARMPGRTVSGREWDQYISSRIWFSRTRS